MNRKIIYSHWSNNTPINKSITNWLHPKYFLYSLGFSVFNSIKLFNEVELYTDSTSYDIFKSLGLPFTKIHNNLDYLNSYDNQLWAIAKLGVHELQSDPYIHIDTDVFITDKLSDNFLNNRLSCQSIDNYAHFMIYEKLLDILKINNAWVPDSDFYDLSYSHNLGIIVINDMKFKSEMTKLSFEFIKRNNEIMKKNPHNLWSMIIEQYIFSYVAFKMNITPELINNDSYNYTHLLHHKKNILVMNDLEDKVKILYPEYYDIVNSILILNKCVYL